MELAIHGMCCCVCTGRSLTTGSRRYDVQLGVDSGEEQTKESGRRREIDVVDNIVYFDKRERETERIMSTWQTKDIHPRRTR